MKVINFGSLNIDLVYQVHDFARPGETISARGFSRFPGGKGLNQSIALARAGAPVMHAGAIGTDGQFLVDLLESSGADCRGISILSDTPSGHAVIQVADSGENCIVLFGGANHSIDMKKADEILAYAVPGDILLLQNEISGIPYIMRKAASLGMRIFFNPAPMTPEVLTYPLETIDTLIVNETEAEMMDGHYPSTANVLKTLGADGVIYNNTIKVPAEHVDTIVDTTAAGDTFIGYFIAGLVRGNSIETCLENATRASAWCIQHLGAAPSIPTKEDLYL